MFTLWFYSSKPNSCPSLHLVYLRFYRLDQQQIIIIRKSMWKVIVTPCAINLGSNLSNDMSVRLGLVRLGKISLGYVRLGLPTRSTKDYHNMSHVYMSIWESYFYTSSY